MLTRTVLRINSLRRVSPLVVFIAALLGPPIALGQTNSTWNGGTGNWSNATDWTPNQVPNNGGGNMYNVMIDSGNTAKVILDQTQQLLHLRSEITALPRSSPGFLKLLECRKR